MIKWKWNMQFECNDLFFNFLYIVFFFFFFSFFLSFFCRGDGVVSIQKTLITWKKLPDESALLKISQPYIRNCWMLNLNNELTTLELKKLIIYKYVIAQAVIFTHQLSNKNMSIVSWNNTYPKALLIRLLW